MKLKMFGYRNEREKNDELSHKLSRVKSREINRQEEEINQKRKSLDRTADLETRNMALRETKVSIIGQDS
jgi:hypothetical protein